MSIPYGWDFAVLCALQGALVALGWRRRWRLGASWLIGAALPVGALAIGLAVTRDPGWGADALATLATFGAPVAAMGAGWALGARPATTIVLVPVAFLVAWRADGLVADGAAVAIIGAACLTIAAVIAAATPPRAIAAGLVVLAVVDSILVFRGHVSTSTVTLHAVEPPVAGGRPLPALQDATFGDSLYGWLDLLAPALAGMLFVERPHRRALAAWATVVASLTWALLLGVTDEIPGTVPPLAAVAVWALSRPAHPRLRVREVMIRPIGTAGGDRPGRVGR